MEDELQMQQSTKMSLPTLLSPQTPKISSLFSSTASLSLSSHLNLSSLKNLTFTAKFLSISPSFQSSLSAQYDDVEDPVIGDCVVFEDGVFDDPYLQSDSNVEDSNPRRDKSKFKIKSKAKRNSTEIEPENLVPDKWREVQEEINITKKERRKISQQLEFGRRVEKKKRGLIPVRDTREEFLAYKEAKLAQLKPLVLDNPSNFPVKEKREIEESGNGEFEFSSSERVAPKNPRWAVYGRGLEDVSEFFNSGKYEPGDKKSQGPRKLFSKEEKFLLNRRIPDLAAATSDKWLPLHTLAASGELFLVGALLKHNVNINAADMNGWTALHKAIICKKQAITNLLLRESANPFVRDKEGATLMHYAVRTASSQTIKILLLYNVDINLPDNDGWTPLHLAVQARRTDVVRLLLIKGADKTLKNQDGLTPLDLCLYSGRDTRTYELIKLLKQLPKPR